ncbi:13603_t:CDS:2, partial [Dentiscutata heterogama]
MELPFELFEVTPLTSNAESSKENVDSIDEETERYQTTIDELINKLKLCCSYKNKCSDKVLPDLLQFLVSESIKINKQQRHYSMIILMASSNKRPHKQQFHIKYQLLYFSEVCSSFFQIFWTCGRDAFYHLCRQVQEKQSMLPQPHRTIGHLPVNKLSVKTVSEVKFFIKSVRKQYSEVLAVQ